MFASLPPRPVLAALPHPRHHLWRQQRAQLLCGRRLHAPTASEAQAAEESHQLHQRPDRRAGEGWVSIFERLFPFPSIFSLLSSLLTYIFLFLTFLSSLYITQSIPQALPSVRKVEISVRRKSRDMLRKGKRVKKGGDRCFNNQGNTYIAYINDQINALEKGKGWAGVGE